ncbi:MAG: hypothetical protein ACR2N5_02565 [Solirubrobacterales bacterium]
MPVALSNGEVILLVVFVAFPIAAIAFVGAGALYRGIGKGMILDDEDLPAPAPVFRDSMTEGGAADREEEIRQMLEAKAYRQRQRGDEPIDVEDELARLMNPSPITGADPELVTEVRQLVIARNERRMRRGEEPLDVESEVARQLRDLENLGQ